MNQILNTKLEENKKKYKKKNLFQIQFIFSVIVIGILLFITFFNLNNLKIKEKYSDNLINNYNIFKLYNSSSNSNSDKNISNSLFGTIDIPKINIYYPVFSYLTEDLLKIAPCKFYGSNTKENGNICIAGHNYDNSLFFSKIPYLSTEDIIIIYDIDNKKYVYYVYEIYEVNESDISPILNYDKNEKNLTLVTCNNFNLNRIIVRAKQK